MLSDVQIFETRFFPDDRGYLLQSYMKSDLAARGVPASFCQAIQSKSRRGVVRGLHFQWDPPQGKLIRCVSGRILDVVVDIRRDSQSLGRHVAAELSEENRRALWVPPGFAHGFMSIEEGSIVLYECTAEWAPQAEGGILWNDPELGIDWPEIQPIISAKDRKNPTLRQWLQTPESHNF